MTRQCYQATTIIDHFLGYKYTHLIINLSPEETAAGLPTTSRDDAPQEEAIVESINRHFKQNKTNQALFNPIHKATEDDEPVAQDTIGRECKIYVTIRHLLYSCSRVKVVFFSPNYRPACSWYPLWPPTVALFTARFLNTTQELFELARLPKLCPRIKHINVCYNHF